MPFMLIPFAVFFCCCAAQFFFMRRVRQVLATRHPETWLKISTNAWFADNAVVGFAWGRRDKGLNDPELTRKVKQLRLLHFVAIASWLAFVGLMVTGVGLRQISLGLTGS